MWAKPLDTCMLDIRFREKFQDALAVVISDEERAGLDILTHGDFHCDEDFGGRSWHHYPLQRWTGFRGRSPSVGGDAQRVADDRKQPILSYWGVRNGRSQQWPPVSHHGPQVMLINGWSGSGGDAFPFYFREAGRGPLIGTRTWGGLIGISGAPALADGGNVTVPTFRMYDPKGQWFAEGHGVDPDIPIGEDPTALAKGTDPQLERAIKEVTDRIAKQPATPPRPAYERRVPKGGGSNSCAYRG